MTLIYNYDKKTKVYTNTTIAKPCPLGGNDRIPAHATTIPIPDLSDKECAVWDGSAWTIGPDLRGTVYWINHYESKTITEINTDIPFDAWCKIESANLKASTTVVLLSTIDISFWFGILITVSHALRNSVIPASPRFILLGPSKLNGNVTTPTVSIPISRAI